MRLSIVLAVCFIGVSVSGENANNDVFQTPIDLFDQNKVVDVIYYLINQMQSEDLAYNPAADAILDFVNSYGRRKSIEEFFKILNKMKDSGNPTAAKIFEFMTSYEETGNFFDDFFITLHKIRDQPHEEQKFNPLALVDQNKIVEIIYKIFVDMKNQNYDYNPVAEKIWYFVNTYGPSESIGNFLLMINAMKDSGNTTAAKILEFIRSYKDIEDFFKMLEKIKDQEPITKPDYEVFQTPINFFDQNLGLKVFYYFLNQMQYEDPAYNPLGPIAEKILDFVNTYGRSESIKDYVKILNKMKDSGDLLADKILQYIDSYGEKGDFFDDFFKTLHKIRTHPHEEQKFDPFFLLDQNKIIEIIYKILVDMKNQNYDYNPVAGTILDFVNTYGRSESIKDFFEMLNKMKDSGNTTAAKVSEFITSYIDIRDFFKMLEKIKDQEPRTKRAVNPLDLLNSLNDPNKFALNVFSLVGDMVNQQTGGKLGSNPLQLLADLQNPQKAFKSIFKIVSDMAQERPKRDIASNMQEQAQKLYDNIKAAIEKMFKKPAQEVVA